MTQKIAERLDLQKERESARERARNGVWGPVVRLRDKQHAEDMNRLETFGGVLEAAGRDGRRGEPNKFFLSPDFDCSGVYREVYAIQFYVRKGLAKERAAEIALKGYRYY